MHEGERESLFFFFDLARVILSYPISHEENDELHVNLALGFLCKCLFF